MSVAPTHAPRTARLLMAALLGVIPFTAGCKTVKEAYADTVLRGETITYEQYLSMITIDQAKAAGSGDPANADQLIARLGKPASVYDLNGKRRKIVYNAFSLSDELKKAEFHFNENEVLMKKQLW